jgi:RNA polymerase primary sigma factor
MSIKKQALNSNNQLSQEKSLSVYLHDISRTKPLSSKDEAELTIRIRNGDQTALETLVRANLRFVVSVSKSYQNQGVPLVDLINEGNLGLINAAKRFDEKKNFRFISYAVWWIRQAMLQILADQSRILRIPLNRVGNLHKIGVAQQKLEKQFGRNPSTEEIATELNVSDSTIQKMMQIGSRSISLDAPLDGNSDSDLHELISSEQAENAEDSLFDSFLQSEIEKVLQYLDSREKEIVKMYYGIGFETTYSLGEIGHRYKLTRERIRQIKEKAIVKLKKHSSMNKLHSFL